MAMTTTTTTARRRHGNIMSWFCRNWCISNQISDVQVLDAPLIDACKSGSYQEVKEVLDRGIYNVDAHDEYGNTPLIISARSGNIQVLKLLLCYGADIDKCNTLSDSTALMEAIQEGHIAVVKILLDYIRTTEGKCKEVDTHINRVNRDGRNAVMLAVKGGNYKIVKMILRASHWGSYSVNVCDNYESTPLIETCWQRNYKIAKLLVMRGKADVNYTDYADNSALVCASSVGAFRIVNLLLQNGAYVGSSVALFISARNGHTNICRLLIEHFTTHIISHTTPHTTTDTNINTPLNYPNFDIDFRDYEGNTPIMVASQNNRLYVVKLLIKSGARLDYINTKSQNVLDLSVQHSDFKVASLLILYDVRGNLRSTRERLFGIADRIKARYQEHITTAKQKTANIQKFLLSKMRNIPPILVKIIVWDYVYCEPERIDYQYQ